MTKKEAKKLLSPGLTRRQVLATAIIAPTITSTSPTPIRAIVNHIDALPTGPVWLASYPGDATPPALRNAAFVYDNALALIALKSHGNIAAALRIGEAMLLALDHDRFWHDGRLRNAYRAGPATTPAALPGYWNAKLNLWSEDAYQAGSATGNVAWAALALLHLAPHGARFQSGAQRMIAWLDGNTSAQGIIGGYFGEEPHPIQQNWRSTEQNIDAAVVMRAVGDSRADWCRAFVTHQFDRARGCFNTGSTPGPTALDANLWPLLAFPDPPHEWRRALDWVRAHYGAEGGLGFRDNPDGLWTEGTAQGALTFALSGDPATAAKLLAKLPEMAASNGYLRAANHEIRTGLAIGPHSTSDDFRYYPLPHLGATAWAALAFARVNPFRIDHI